MRAPGGALRGDRLLPYWPSTNHEIIQQFTHRSRKHRRDRDSEARGLTTGEPAPARRGWFGRKKAAPYDNTYGNNSTYAPSSNGNGYAPNGTAAPM